MWLQFLLIHRGAVMVPTTHGENQLCYLPVVRSFLTHVLLISVSYSDGDGDDDDDDDDDNGHTTHSSTHTHVSETASCSGTILPDDQPPHSRHLSKGAIAGIIIAIRQYIFIREPHRQ